MKTVSIRKAVRYHSCCHVMAAGLLAILFFLSPSGALADENIAAQDGGKAAGRKPSPPSPAMPAKTPAKQSPSRSKRDPTRIQPEFQSQMEEVEPPEIRITGMIDVGGRKAAIAELNLEEFEGMVMLEPGMTVSIPKPNRGESESKHWMTFFKVREILGSGVLLVMENGEQIWVPVMGEKD